MRGAGDAGKVEAPGNPDGTEEQVRNK